MRIILPLLFLLCVLISVTKGDVILCKTPNKTNNKLRDYFSAVGPKIRAQSDDFSNRNSDDDNSGDDSFRKESLRNKILRAMLMEDSEDSKGDKARNDYSVLQSSLRADPLRDETKRDEDDWTRRRMGSSRQFRNDYNRRRKFDDDYN